jgi:hypothetical protein
MPSTRRGLLAGIGCVLASTTAGCVSNLRSRLSGPFEGTVSDVSKYYPAESSTTQLLRAVPTDPEDDSIETQSLEALSSSEPPRLAFDHSVLDSAVRGCSGV